MSDDGYPCDDMFFASIPEMTAQGLVVGADLPNTTPSNISDPPSHSDNTVELDLSIKDETDDIELNTWLNSLIEDII